MIARLLVGAVLAVGVQFLHVGGHAVEAELAAEQGGGTRAPDCKQDGRQLLFGGMQGATLEERAFASH